MTSPFPSAPIAGVRVDHGASDMTLDLFISEEAEVCILHNKPFFKTLSWLEYDTITSKVDFVMEDGDIRNLEIPVDPKYRAYFHNAHLVSIVLWNRETRDVESGIELPLIIHAI